MRPLLALALLAGMLRADLAAVPLVEAVRSHPRIVDAEVVAVGDGKLELRVLATLKGEAAPARLELRDARPLGVPPLTTRVAFAKGQRAVFYLDADDVLRMHPAQADAATVAAVVGLLDDPRADRARELLAAADAGTILQVADELPRAPWTEAFLARCLEQPHLRAAACAAIARCRYRGPIPRLRRLVENERSGAAALALAELGATEAAGAVARALADPRPMADRPAALRALGLLAGEDALPALVAALEATGPTGGRTDWSEEERFAATAALGALATAKAVPPLVAALKTADSARLKVEVARALAAHGPEARAALPTLRALAAQDDAHGVAEAARRAIAAIER